jgi:16S rRNA (uracil1498-N3)-methyltransferase
LKLDGERAEKRVAHWNAVAVAACEQCGRNRVPPVRGVQSLDEALADVMGRGHRLALMHPSGGKTLADWAAQSSATPLALLVGPEGGFTEHEISHALAAGATQVTFGPRVLRTETAGLAALAAIQAVLGDLR